MKQLSDFEKQMLMFRIESMKNLSNKEFMVAFASLANDFELLDKEDFAHLQNHDWCRDTIKHEYTIIKPLSKKISNELVEEKKDNTGRQRYYDNVFYLGGHNVLLSSEWYDGKGKKKDNRSNFVEWLRGLAGEKYGISYEHKLLKLDFNSELSDSHFSISTIINLINKTGLLYPENLIKRFAFSLMSKRFLILSGLAGSGKTQLALAFASALVKNKEEQMCVVSVGADWTNREPLLGFPNALQPGKYVKPESGVLDLLIEANRPENADKPFFLILDEMNMSYVERYFADFLSAMESKEPISLWSIDETKDNNDEVDGVPQKVALPKNLFIIGTINVDETTYMFSPKVLDRANVIEFKISPTEMGTFLVAMREIDRDSIIGKAAGMGADFVNKACKKDLDKDDKAVATLQSFFNELKNVNAEFGYRSATEIFRFICQAKANDDASPKMTDGEILDAAIVQKLLPKLHGSRKKLEPVLTQLWKLCFTGAGKDLNIAKENVEKAQFKESADKIHRMYESATANGFTSFAEA